MTPLFEKKEYESPKRVNTLPFRSGYVPFSILDKFVFTHGIIAKKKSSLYIDLNGEWQFKMHESFHDLKDVNEDLKECIEVPSCVQMKGYDYCQYTNIVYPFPFNPPYVPEKTPLFHYRKTINLHLKDRYYLNFEGVDSGFYVYVNGRYVGYSQVSHSQSEFDVTDFLHEGDNQIDVLVLKWCASSYVEDQDKFRFSGIFRDVYLLNRREQHIRDYKIEPIRKGKKWYFEVENLAKEPFNVHFLRKVRAVEPGKKIGFEVPNPRLWCHEDPYLYTIVLEDGYEQILERLGLREVAIKKGIFLLNGKAIKLKGVNRHESSPINGAAVTLEETYRDLKLILKMNANAIRTSHYPDRYEFYQLCDRLGIYVLNEADVETHGAHLNNGKWDYPHWQAFADSMLLEETIFDREVSCYEREKNRPCVIIFSLGNESSYGKSFHRGADYIHAHDTRPIHYEGLHNLYDRSDYYTKRVDICSRMYPSPKAIVEEYLKDEQEKRPLLLCEYTHAMGNSSGDVADYWKLISKEKRIIGAFVWEWCDHAVYRDGHLLYGSDFPEHYNDGNFCVDGLVTPWRKFKSSTREVAAVYNGRLYPDKPRITRKFTGNLSSKNPVKVEFDKTKPSIKKIFIHGKNILTYPLELCFLRAPLDNDMPEEEKRSDLNKAQLKFISQKDGKNEKSYDLLLAGEREYATVSICFKTLGNAIKIRLKYQIIDPLRPYRLGLRFAIPNRKTYTFEGYGPDESYIDKCVHCQYGEFTLPVKKDFVEYLKPQEAFSHYYVSYLTMDGLTVYARKPFSFSALPYSLEQLSNARHNYELKSERKTFIHLDLAMAGVGSHACGPELDEKYLIPASGENEFILLFE